ncbi:hypothetical protein GCWU000341_01925 [Oribacterium sp. oral taxon 078 str. F0262]|nr:hypothetical protein GCWU000341_01925 [Oribacterium sp. oral taxon 078 str. F0262]
MEGGLYGTPLYEQEAGAAREVRIKGSVAEAMRNHEKEPCGSRCLHGSGDVLLSAAVLPLRHRGALVLHRAAAMRQEMSGNFGIMRT